MARFPRAFDTPFADEMLRMNTELLAELWIVKDRLLVLERILQDKLGLSSEEIDRYVPDRELTEKLDREREAMMKKVMLAPFADDDRRVDTILAAYLGKRVAGAN